MSDKYTKQFIAEALPLAQTPHNPIEQAFELTPEEKAAFPRQRNLGVSDTWRGAVHGATLCRLVWSLDSCGEYEDAPPLRNSIEDGLQRFGETVDSLYAVARRKRDVVPSPKQAQAFRDGLLRDLNGFLPLLADRTRPMPGSKTETKIAQLSIIATLFAEFSRDAYEEAHYVRGNGWNVQEHPIIDSFPDGFHIPRVCLDAFLLQVENAQGGRIVTKDGTFEDFRARTTPENTRVLAFSGPTRPNFGQTLVVADGTLLAMRTSPLSREQISPVKFLRHIAHTLLGDADDQLQIQNVALYRSSTGQFRTWDADEFLALLGGRGSLTDLRHRYIQKDVEWSPARPEATVAEPEATLPASAPSSEKPANWLRRLLRFGRQD